MDGSGKWLKRWSCLQHSIMSVIVPLLRIRWNADERSKQATAKNIVVAEAEGGQEELGRKTKVEEE